MCPKLLGLLPVMHILYVSTIKHIWLNSSALLLKWVCHTRETSKTCTAVGTKAVIIILHYIVTNMRKGKHTEKCWDHDTSLSLMKNKIKKVFLWRTRLKKTMLYSLTKSTQSKIFSLLHFNPHLSLIYHVYIYIWLKICLVQQECM